MLPPPAVQSGSFDLMLQMDSSRRGRAAQQAAHRPPVSRALFARGVGSAGLLAMPSAAIAQEQPILPFTLPLQIEPLHAIALACFIAMTVLLVVVTMMYSAARRAAQRARTQLRHSVGDLRARIDETEVLLNTDDQRLVVWNLDTNTPDMFGTLPASADAPRDRKRFLAFGSWLTEDTAQYLDEAIDQLRAKGAGFSITVETKAGAFLEATGRTSGGRSLVRFRDLTTERSEFAALNARHEHLTGQFETIRALLDATSEPVWQKGADGRLIWANPPYRTAVDADDDASIIDLPSDLLETSERAKLAAARGGHNMAKLRLPVVVQGDRRAYEVVEVVTDFGSASMAIDVSELDRLQTTLKRTSDFHARTLDQLATAVAIYGSDQHLEFHNNAFQKLWDLDPSFLENQPEDSAVLERLRSERKLPEQADFRTWKAEMMEIYRAVDAQEHWWHLPDGKTVRVLANPHPQGGVTYIYENVTEQLSLESRYNALIRVQGETLDYLAEAVAVYGPDGKLRLWNPAFKDMWRVSEAELDRQPHVSEVVAWCSRLFPSQHLWSSYTASVTGLAETRESTQARIERPDSAVIDVSTVPLPDGSTLSTFVDVSDTVKVERALTEKNAALQAADGLKNAFIQHVSYELRSPLTNIIGFTQLLADSSIGPLNDKQNEYTGYILSSSSALLTIVNDILDLATIDAGIMELELSDVYLRDTIDAAVDALQDRLAEAEIKVHVNVDEGLGHLQADEKRLRQIFYNLVSNAISYSDDGSVINVTAEQVDAMVQVSVADNGCGIPNELIESVFDRFEGHSSGARRRGAGLGLSIVKSFVELHNGSVEIHSRESVGTTVICRFPLVQQTIH